MLYEGLAKNSTLTIHGLQAGGSRAHATQALSALPSCFDGPAVAHSRNPVCPKAGLLNAPWPRATLHKQNSSYAVLALSALSTNLFQPNIQPFTANRPLPGKAERHSCVPGLIWRDNEILTNL